MEGLLKESAQNRIAFPISVYDLDKVPSLVNSGLQGLAFCAHGVARSWKYAEKMTANGVYSAFFEGGFDALAKLEATKRVQVIRILKDVPERWALLNTNEVKKYADILRGLEACLINGQY